MATPRRRRQPGPARHARHARQDPRARRGAPARLPAVARSRGGSAARQRVGAAGRRIRVTFALRRAPTRIGLSSLEQAMHLNDLKRSRKDGAARYLATLTDELGKPDYELSIHGPEKLVAEAFAKSNFSVSIRPQATADDVEK